MKIVLSTEHVTAPSTELNRSILEKIGSDFVFQGDLREADIILFMGYDPQIDKARKVNPEAKIGIIDPRPFTVKHLKKADFFLANGVEMVNAFVHEQPNYFIYPIYQVLHSERIASAREKRVPDGVFRIGYHGNKAHLEQMEETVCPALERLSRDHSIEIIALYNHEQLGKWKWQPMSKSIKVIHIHWAEGAYYYLADCDIGIVPNLF
jgi:hypothetical protein